MFKNLLRISISKQLIAIVLILLTGYAVNTVLSLTEFRKELLDQRQTKTRHVVETASGVLQHFYDRQLRGELDEAQAQKAAREAVSALRYEKKEYFWINDMTPSMVMHPIKPKLDGKDLAGFKDPNGKHLFVAFVDKVKQDGAGFVDYLWPKPGQEEPVAKISYVKGFKPWGWIIGSGIYLDDVDNVYWAEAKRQIVLGTIIGLLVFAFAGYLAWRIRWRLERIVAAMNDIADGDGDLTRRLDKRGNDEIAAVGEAFNRFVDKISDMVTDVTSSTLKLSSSAEQVSAVSEETSQAVAQQQERTSEVVGSVHQFSETVAAVAQRAAEAASLAQGADQRAAEARQTVDLNRDAIQTLASSVEEAADVITQLNEQSDSIGTIVDVIRNIAEQTNLLALNAAIEAARAGEQGRGFAVVADEVRTLASRTQESTEEIRNLIHGLQEQAAKAAEVMEVGRSGAEETVGRVGEVADNLNAISAEIASIAQMNGQIAGSAEEQAGMTETMRANLDTIDELAAVTLEGATRTEAATGQLGQAIGTLQGMVMQFKVGGEALDLSAAKSAHLNWKTRLRAFLDGEATLTEEQAVSHHHCDFGKWYYSEGQARWGHIPEMGEVEAPHAELHALIKQIVKARHAGDTAEAEALYRKVDGISRRIVGLLDQVELKASRAS